MKIERLKELLKENPKGIHLWVCNNHEIDTYLFNSWIEEMKAAELCGLFPHDFAATSYIDIWETEEDAKRFLKLKEDLHNSLM